MSDAHLQKVWVLVAEKQADSWDGITYFIVGCYSSKEAAEQAETAEREGTCTEGPYSHCFIDEDGGESSWCRYCDIGFVIHEEELR